jgi:hypothetical protein
VAAGQRNVQLRSGLSAEGVERVRAAALAHQPWRFSTGPRTPEGKAKSAANGTLGLANAGFSSELCAELAEARAWIAAMQVSRANLSETLIGD